MIDGIPAYGSMQSYVVLALGFAFYLGIFVFIDWLERRKK
jgi:hypothetical protein